MQTEIIYHYICLDIQNGLPVFAIKIFNFSTLHLHFDSACPVCFFLLPCTERILFFIVSLASYNLAIAEDFSCEVESDGRVLIKGVTSMGEKTVEKYSQVFEMQSQNLCPPGPFSLSFKLPGPVDPQQFLGTFATDAIFEGIAWKARRNRI